MMWNANYGGPLLRLHHVPEDAADAVDARRHRGRQRGAARASARRPKAWVFKHPSPWDYMFFMNQRAEAGPRLVLVLLAVHHRERWTVDREARTSGGKRTTVTVRQDGQMPSPVVLRGEVRGERPGVRPMKNAVMRQPHRDGDVAGGRLVQREAGRSRRTWTSAGAKIEKIMLDPGQRFPDRDSSDNVWPRPAAK